MSASMSVTGQCLCGATTYSSTSAPKFAIRCFCTDCQRVSGTGSAPQVAFDSATLTTRGPLKHHFADSDEGNRLDFAFCGDCGSPLLKSTSKAAAIVFAYAGSLNDASSVPTVIRCGAINLFFVSSVTI